ncbi:peptidase M61 [Idiomarina tyrosinivorans]|uniref:Peptidase M61 n=1 Tax=Idiomarina tyrosinivorans TaxID=1445662 RepID=A0A432ZS05_9GAMM|nr:PDZ domain-containing protein [Idiomarina tyrosinivorans]RUO80642.1 peptidase M61 [Idiomarina tyrosinivorans]
MKKTLLAMSMMAAFAAQASEVEYRIDLTHPEHHTGDVSMTFPETKADHLDVKMAAWRTGLYHILDLASGVREFVATDDDGNPLRWEKVDKSTWRIYLPEATEVNVSYQLYANELGRRSRHIDDSHAYLDASAVFMYTDQYRQEEANVTLEVPPSWRSVSGLERTGEHAFSAENWDVLVDSPIETGINKVFDFEQGEQDYQVVFWGHGNYDAEQTVADLKKMVAQASTIWEGYPFERYVFMIHATDGAGGATEHKNSTVIQRPRFSFAPHDEYLSFLSTASHEFIHTWNVKAYRADGLVPYDYQKENYTDLLWMHEGSTSYFQDHLLLRADIMKPTEYFDHLASAIQRHKHKPGAEVMSVAEASFESWIDQYGDRARNYSVNIYSEGAIVSWMLDIALLQETDGKVSYRDVHNALYQRFDADKEGFNDADVLAILKDLTGKSWQTWWQQHVMQPVDVDFTKLLEPVGLKLSYGNSDDVEMRAWAGWSAKPADNGMQLTLVERNSPAWDAGFTPDDIIVAFNGIRVDDKRFKAALKEMQPGDEVTVTYFRRDQLAEKTLTLGKIPKNDAKVVPVDEPTAAQKALFEQWLLIPYPGSEDSDK